MHIFEIEVKSSDYRRWQSHLNDLFDHIKNGNYITSSFHCGQLAQMFGDRAEVLESSENV